ncbi:MAG: hypothetical protein U9R21_03645 [Candidatus Thermoplasmatota archaeon]|nr:hypothetical protein [Candidatus Thermoplasmatota archaeon]
MTINDAGEIKGDTNLKTYMEKDFDGFCGDTLGILHHNPHAQGRWSEISDRDVMHRCA